MLPDRIQILLGSEVIQLWFPSEPHFKELNLGNVCGQMLHAFIKNSHKYKLVAISSSVETYERVQEPIH